VHLQYIRYSTAKREQEEQAMDTVTQIEQQRRQVLIEMDEIRSLERATLCKQMLRVKHKGQKEPVVRGPYYVLARWENGRTRSRRVRDDELEQMQRDVANHERFMALCERFMELTEQLGATERALTTQDESLKKTPKSPSKRTKK
jgi:hypothetical protein